MNYTLEMSASLWIQLLYIAIDSTGSGGLPHAEGCYEDFMELLV